MNKIQNKILKYFIFMFISCAIQPVLALKFGVFSDILFNSNDAPDENTGFLLNALDFYATTNINDDTHIFIEYNKHLPDPTNSNSNTTIAIQWSFLVP